MFEELDELVHAEMARAKLPGLAIALVKDNEIVWSRGYGYADLENKTPVTPETVFSVQSVTKPVVTTALMQWYERGCFQLDDPVNDHLAPLQVQNEWEDTKPVTIRGLVTHTSGLPVDLQAAAPPSEGVVPLADYLAEVAKTVRPPGEEMVYANWGYDITGYLVGRLAGRSYDAYLAEQVLGPLGMSSSFIRPPTGAVLPTGYFLSALDRRHHAGETESFATDPARPSAALYSTVEDLARFLIAHLNGGVCEGRRVLKEETVAEMHRLHARWGPSRGGMGLGFRVEGEGARRLICHGGDGTHFTAFVGAHPDERVGVALLINMGRAQTARSVIAQGALRSLLGQEAVSEPETIPAREADGEWERAVGSYVSTFWSVEATLTVDDGVPSVNVEGGVVASEGGERSYLRRGADGMVRGVDGAFDGFEVTFEHGPDGKATKFYGGVYPFRFDRVGDVEPPTEIDEGADVMGRWNGTVQSPLGPVPVEINVSGERRATATALAAQDAVVEEFSAARGRVEGHFDTSLPGFGEIRIFLRLHASQGKLCGRAYARGDFGEVPMKAELTRE